MFKQTSQKAFEPTIVFNVGGRIFEISRDIIPKDCTLGQYHKSPVMLDHNPDAFQVILDFLRYKQLLCPPTVCKEVIELQLRQFGLRYKEIQDKKDGPPSYEQTATSVMHSKLESLVTLLKPLVVNHAQNGHVKVDMYILDHAVTNIASSIDDDAAVEWIYLAPQDVKQVIQKLKITEQEKLLLISAIPAQPQLSLTTSYLLTLPDFSKLKDIIMKGTSVAKCDICRYDLTYRTEDQFGLLQSQTVDCVKISLKLA